MGRFQCISPTLADHTLEVLITLALVTGALQVSGPIAVVVAGLVLGNHGLTQAMTEATRDYVTKFWDLIDLVLNAVLFLLIGLEVLVIDWTRQELLLGLASIPSLPPACLIAVSISFGFLSTRLAI